MDPMTAAIIGVITGLSGLIAAITAWVKAKTETERIRAERAETCKSRDEDSQRMHDEIIRLTCKSEEQENNIKVLFEQSVTTSKQMNAFSSQLTEVIVQMKNILETLKELKDKVK